MAAGNASNAYASATPVSQDMSQFVDNINDTGFRFRAEKRLEDGIAEKKAKAAQEEEEERLKWFASKTPKDKASGVQTIDFIKAKAVQSAVDEQFEAYKIYKDKSRPESERLQALIRIDNLKNAPENILAGVNNFVNTAKTYSEDLASGKIFRDEDYERMIASGFNGSAVGFDKNGHPLVGFQDVDGDGKIDFLGWESLQDPVLGRQFQQRHNIDADAVAIASKLKPEDIKVQRGYVTERNKRVAPEIIVRRANDYLYNPDGSPKSTLRSALRESNLEDTPENRQAVQRAIETRILDNTEKLYEKDIDLGAQDRDIDRADRRKKEAEDNPPPTTVNASDTVFVDDERFSGKDKEGNRTKGGLVISKSGILPKGVRLGKALKIDNIGGEKGLSNVEVENVFIGQDGKITYTAKIPEDKVRTKDDDGSTTTEQPAYRQVTREASGSTKAAIAGALFKAGVIKQNNEEGLEEYLYGLNGGRDAKPVSSSKTKIQGF